MNLDDELQRQFDQAREAVDLEPGSASSVRERADRQARTARVATMAAVAFIVGGVGYAAARATGSLTERPIAVATDDSNPANGQTENENTGAEGDEGEELLIVEEAPTDTGQQEDPTGERTGRLTENDLQYLGAFMAPAGEIGESQFAFGGSAAAFNPLGDPANDDAYPGSLFMSGHPVRNHGVAELTIPTPAQHNGSTEGLPVAEVLQPFADLTDGRGELQIGEPEIADDYRFGGLEIADGPTGSRLHWTAWRYSHATEEDIPSHGHSSLDLSNPDPQGPWFLDNHLMGETAGYLFTAPTDFADEHLDGHRFITGFQAEAAGADNSWGPPFFAYTPPLEAEPSRRLDAIELAHYGFESDEPLADYEATDLMPGATWVADATGDRAIVVVGHKSLGPARQGLPAEGDCNQYAGAHGDPYEPRVAFYDPEDLARVAAGDLDPAQVEPYRTWNPVEHLVTTCDWLLSSISFDETTGRLYVVQVNADTSQDEFSPVPVVHVFQVG